MRRVISLVTVPAAAPSPSPPAGSAGDRTEPALVTAVGEPPVVSSPGTPDEIMLEAFRPRTWGDCQRDGWGDEEPCPWVACTNHLLLEISDNEREGQGYRLNEERGRGGRPKLIRPRTEEESDAFIERAVELLFTKRITCARRRADMGRATLREIGAAMGIRYQVASGHIKRALRTLKEEHGIDLNPDAMEASK